MNAHAWRIAAALVLLAGLAACAGKPDMRYRDSVDDPPLVIPPGLDTPAYSRAMEIPVPGPVALPEPDADIERPPSLSGAAGAARGAGAQ